MALSDKARKRLEVALARRNIAVEVADAIDAGGNAQAAAVADIANPLTATAEDCANKINELMASLRDAGLLAE
jgi:hypothetical protein